MIQHCEFGMWNLLMLLFVLLLLVFVSVSARNDCPDACCLQWRFNCSKHVVVEISKLGINRRGLNEINALTNN